MTEYSDFAKRYFDDQQRSAIGNLGSLTDEDDPDKAAQATDLSKTTSVPSSVIYADFDGFTKQHKELIQNDLIKRNPKLQSYYADPMAARISADDVGPMDEFSEKLDKLNPKSVREAIRDSVAVFDQRKEGQRGLFQALADYPGHFLSGLLETAAYPGTVAASDKPISTGEMVPWAADTAMQMVGMGTEIPRVAGPVATKPVTPKEAHGWFAEETRNDAKALDDAIKARDGTETHERAPEMTRRFADIHGPDIELGIDPERVRQLYGDTDAIFDDNKLGWIPDLREKLDYALATGDKIYVPRKNWLANIDAELHKELRDDIQFRGGGLTLNEIKDLAERLPQSGPIAEAMPIVRAEMGGEPLFSIGDRRVTLKRKGRIPEEGFPQAFHDFAILDQNGKEIGAVNLSTQAPGDYYIDMIQAGPKAKGYSAFNYLGPANIRSLARQLKAELPDLQIITGFRAGGARWAGFKEGEPLPAGSFMTPKVKLDAPLEPVDYETLNHIFTGEWRPYHKGVSVAPDRPMTIDEIRASTRVRELLNRIVPTATADTVPAIRDTAGASARGVYFPDLAHVLIALDSEDAMGTARHEAVHHLKRQGFFTSDEWLTLIQAARNDNWLAKHRIEQRYPDLTTEGQIEESIADAYKAWGRNKAEYSGPVGQVFQKLADFFSALKAQFKDMFGPDLTWQEIFQRVERGEVGGRELEAAPTERLEPAFSVEGGEPEPVQVELPFASGKAIGISQTRFNNYQRLIQRRHVADLEADFNRAKEAIGRRETKEWRENRAELRKQVEDDVRSKPQVMLQDLLDSNPQFRFRRDMVSEELQEKLPKEYLRRDGYSPDDIAGALGYPDGESLLQHLADVTADRKTAGLSLKDYIKQLTDTETDRRMEQEYGLLEKNILEDARDRALSENNINIIREEMLALGEKLGVKKLEVGDIEADLRETFDKTPIGQIKSTGVLQASGKADVNVQKALEKGDEQEAFKWLQVSGNGKRMAKLARAYEDSRRKFDNTVNRLKGVFNEDKAKVYDPNYYAQAQGLLTRLGIKVRTNPGDVIRNLEASGTTSLAQFAANSKALARNIKLPNWLTDDFKIDDFNKLTADQFDDVQRVIAAMDHHARTLNKVYAAGREAERGIVLDGMKDQVKTIYPEVRADYLEASPPEDIKKQFRKLRSISWSMIKIGSMANRLDRGDRVSGLFSKYIWRPTMEGASGERGDLLRIRRAIKKIDWSEPNLDKIIKNDVVMDGDTGLPLTLRQRDIYGMVGYWGNPSSRTKMLRGWKLDTEEGRAALEELILDNTKEQDWRNLERLGRMSKTFFDGADRMSRRVDGVGIKEIQTYPITNKYGTFNGWYWPLEADPMRPGAPQAQVKKSLINMDTYNWAEDTNQGYAQARGGAIYPIQPNIDYLLTRLEQMIHDTHFRPIARQVGELVMDDGLQRTINARYGKDKMDEMESWFRDIVNDANRASNSERALDGILNFFRQNTLITLVGRNVGTLMKHTGTAAFNSIAQVGPKNFAVGFGKLFTKDPETNMFYWNMMMSRSDFMQNRMHSLMDYIQGTQGLKFDKKWGRLGPFTVDNVAQLREFLMFVAQSPVALGDLLSAAPTWAAEYNKQITDHGNIDLSTQLADEAVRMAHGDSTKASMPGIMRQNTLGRFFTSLYGFFSAMMQRGYEMAWKSRDIANGLKPLDIQGPWVPHMLGKYMATFIIPAVIEELVSPYISDNDSWGTKIAKASAIGISSMVPYVRDFVRAVINMRDPQAGIMGEGMKGTTDLWRAIMGKQPATREHAGKIIKNAFTAVGYLTGMATRSDGAIAEYLYRYSHNLERPQGPWGTTTGLRYGSGRGHSKTFDEWWDYTIRNKDIPRGR